MSLDRRRRVVRRLDALLLAGLLLTSGAAGLLFALRFYSDTQSGAESAADTSLPPTASLAGVEGRAPAAPPVVAPLDLTGAYVGAPLVLRGQAGPGVILQVYDGQELIALAVAGEDGTWAAELPAGLQEGEHTLAVVAIAKDGTVSQRVPVGFAVVPLPTVTSTQTPSPTSPATETPAPMATFIASATPRPTDTPTTTLVPSATPDLEATVEALLANRLTQTAQSWTDTPTVTLTPTPSATFTATPSPTASVTPSATATQTPTLTATLTPTTTFSPTPTHSPTATASPTVTASWTPSPTRTPLSRATAIPPEVALLPPSTATLTPAPTETPLPTDTATFTPAPTETPLPSNTPTLTPVPSATPDLDATIEVLLADRLTQIAQSWTDTPTVTLTPTPSATLRVTPTLAPTETAVPTDTVSPSPAPPTRTPVSLGPVLASPTPAFLVPPGPVPRIDAPASGEVRAPGPLVVRGVAEPGATVVVRDHTTGASLAVTQALGDSTWTAQFSATRAGPLILAAFAPGSDGLIRVSEPVTITIAPPVQPVSGGMLLPDAQRAGRLFTALLAVLLVAGGGSTFVAGRLLIMLVRDHRRRPH